MIKMIVCTMVVMLAACAPAPAARMSAAAPVASAAHSEPVSTPAPAPVATNFDPSVVSRTCKVDADCAVKDVGSCCGRYPACVNKDAQTNPAKVRAQCGKEHRFGVCNVPAIGGCSCMQGQCRDINSAQMPGTN